MHDLKTWASLKDLMDAHEALDLREAMKEKMNET
jgi:hypothetical protein